ncbi:hypothetical protein Tco_0650760 [Tanacetum coccineum]
MPSNLFGGNDESKKMQKYILKQQFEEFFVSNSEGLHKGYDRFQSLLSQLEIHGAGVSTEDANKKFLRSLPSHGSTASSSSPQNVAFVSENTSSTNEVSTAYCVPNPSGQNSKYEQTSSYSLLANQSSCPQLDHEDLNIDEYDLEEIIKGTQDNRRRDAWNSGNKDGSRTGQKEDSKALVTIDGEVGVDQKTYQKELRETWNNVQRVNKQNQFVPSAVLTRTGKIPVNTARASGTKNVSTARQSFNRQTVLTSTAMKVNTVKPTVNRVRPANVFHKTHSPYTRPFKKTTVLRTVVTNQKLNTAKDYPHRALKNKGIVDSGCSRHMTGNKAYLAEFPRLLMVPSCLFGELQHFNLFSVSQICDKKNKVLFTDSECLVLSSEFKLPDENQVLLKIPKQNNMYSFNLENIVPTGGLACLIQRPTTMNLTNGTGGGFSWVFFLRTKDETSAILKDESAQDCFVLPIWPFYSSTNTPDLNSNEKRDGPREEEQVFLEELERLKRQENEANEEAEALRKEFEQETENLVIQERAAKTSSTNIFSTVSTPAKANSTNLVNIVSIPVSTANPHEGLSLSDPTNPEQDDSEIPPL